MRFILILLSACVVLALIKAVIIALLIVLAVSVVWAACSHPRELLTLLACLLTFNIVAAHPWATLGVVLLCIGVAH